jgi:hypothetical protein
MGGRAYCTLRNQSIYRCHKVHTCDGVDHAAGVVLHQEVLPVAQLLVHRVQPAAHSGWLNACSAWHGTEKSSVSAAALYAVKSRQSGMTAALEKYLQLTKKMRKLCANYVQAAETAETCCFVIYEYNVEVALHALSQNTGFLVQCRMYTVEMGGRGGSTVHTMEMRLASYTSNV